MKRSKKPTAHILIKAYTDSDWEDVEFAVIHLTELWKAAIASRLQAIAQFKTEEAFNCHSFWDASACYYGSSGSHKLLKKILPRHDDWAYVTLSAETELAFYHREDPLQAQQILITANGIAHFKAYHKRSLEEYRTAEFNLKKLFKP